MNETAPLTVTPAMKDDFEACMVALRTDDPAPFKSDVRDVIAGYGREYAAAWLRSWRETLEADHTAAAGAEAAR